MSQYDEDGDRFYDEDDQDMVYLKFRLVKQETKSAWLVEFGEGLDAEQAWLPKSQCVMIDTETIEVPEWLVIEKDLDLFEK